MCTREPITPKFVYNHYHCGPPLSCSSRCLSTCTICQYWLNSVVIRFRFRFVWFVKSSIRDKRTNTTQTWMTMLTDCAIAIILDENFFLLFISIHKYKFGCVFSVVHVDFCGSMFQVCIYTFPSIHICMLQLHWDGIVVYTFLHFWMQYLVFCFVLFYFRCHTRVHVAKKTDIFHEYSRITHKVVVFLLLLFECLN